MKTAKRVDTLEGMIISEHDTAPSRLFLIHSGTYRATIKASGGFAAEGFRLARDYASATRFQPATSP